MTIEEIKKKIEDEASLPHTIDILNTANLRRFDHLSSNESYMNGLKCAARSLSMYLRQYEWIRKLYLYIRR